MKLRSITIRGLTRFTGAEPVSIDFDALGPGLVAVVGANGAGKSTILESAPAALWKAFPTRPGSLYDYATGRDAFISATFTDDADHAIEVRVQIDAARRSTESYLFIDGAPVTTGRAAEFAAQVERLFGSQALFLASVFACQTKRGSFLDATKGLRKELFAELLGLGYLETLATAARAEKASADAELSGSRAVLAAAEREAEGLPDAERALAEAQAAADAAAGALDTARMEETAAQAAVARVAAAEERLGALVAAERSAREALTAADAAVRAAEAGPGRATGRRDERLRAVAARGVDRLELAARERHGRAIEALNRRRAALVEQLENTPDLEAARAHVAELEADRARRVELAQRISSLDVRIADAVRDGQAAKAQLEIAEKGRLGAIEILQKQASRLQEVPCTGPAPEIAAACPLLADARGAAASIEKMKAPGERERNAQERYSAAVTTLDALRAERAPLGETPHPEALDPQLQAARRDVAAAEASTHARAQLAELDVEKDDADGRLRADLEAAAEAIRSAAAALQEAEAAYQEELSAADAALAEASSKHAAAAQAAHEAAEALRVARAEAGSPAEAKLRLTEAIAEREKFEARLRAADMLRANYSARVDSLRAKAAQVSDLCGALAIAETHTGDWALLERSLGKDGVQALEVDAAAPEVSGLVNDLLGNCYGPRFSVTLETLAEKRDGGFKEVFDVRVYDGGQERPVEALSGGEKVVIGEAVALAIAILNARKNAVRWRTLWRDETAGALDPENAQAYVRMLRRARELGGFHQVVFVAHQPEVHEAADVRVFVEGGRVSVESQRRAA